MKRFYKETSVEADDDGWRVLLDGKSMRTPAKAVLVLPTRALAGAIAAEWREVPASDRRHRKVRRVRPAVLSRPRSVESGGAPATDLAAAARLGGRTLWRAAC